MASRASRICLQFTIALALRVTSTWAAIGPLQMQWSPSVYGPDGPWHALTVRMGNPQALIDLYPASQVASFIPNPHICSNKSLTAGLSHCPTSDAGIWNYNKSTTADARSVPFVQGLAQFSDPLTLTFDGQTILDTMFPVDDYTISIHNASITTMDWAYYRHPVTGKTYPPAIGTLAIGLSASEYVIGIPPHHRVIENVLPPYLVTEGVTSSSSYGLHIGSVRAGIAPSMFFGGYDRSRVLGPVISQNVDRLNDTFSVNLVDIGIGVAQGASPFSDVSHVNGLLAKGNSSLGPPGFSVYIEPGTPYMFLPPSTCEAIINSVQLPIEFDKDLGFYLWDVESNADLVKAVVESAAYILFKFRSPEGDEIDIKAPMQLFDLTLDYPLVDKPTRYFPCTPYNGMDYTLGRAFLQAAFLGVNWLPAAPSARWFLAQAPGPNTVQTPFITDITTSDVDIVSLHADWNSTWDGYWNVVPEPRSKNSTAMETSDLSADAKIGIGVGVGLGVVALLAVGLCVLSERRKRRIAKEDLMQQHAEYLPYGNRHETLGVPVCEADSRNKLGLPGNPAEVSSWKQGGGSSLSDPRSREFAWELDASGVKSPEDRGYESQGSGQTF